MKVVPVPVRGLFGTGSHVKNNLFHLVSGAEQFFILENDQIVFVTCGLVHLRHLHYYI